MLSSTNLFRLPETRPTRVIHPDWHTFLLLVAALVPVVAYVMAVAL